MIAAPNNPGDETTLEFVILGLPVDDEDVEVVSAPLWPIGESDGEGRGYGYGPMRQRRLIRENNQ